MKIHRPFRALIALGVVAATSFLGVQSASAVSGSITGFTQPVTLTFVGGGTAGAALITLTTADADVLLTYCIDLNTHTGVGVSYDEGTWTAANVPDIDNVRTILQASYPVRTVAQLQQASGIAGLTTQDAIAGTQGAIWHFTDLINLDRSVASQTVTSNVGMLYDYLLGVAANPAVEPAPALSITPATATATVGALVGPFTLHVTPTTATATVTNDAGVGFTDGGGNPLVPTSDGQQFWITPTTVNSFNVNATAELAVPTGRVFLHTTTPANPELHQKLVLAKSDAVTTTASASFTTTAVPPTTTTTTPTIALPVVPSTTIPAEVTTTTSAVLAVLPPVPSTTTAVTALPPTIPANVQLPATGSSSSRPGLILATTMLVLGIGATKVARRARV